MHRLVAVALTLAAVAVGAWTYTPSTGPAAARRSSTIDAIAADYITLVRALGEHDPDSVDGAAGQAVTGPRAGTPALSAVGEEAARLVERLHGITADDALERERVEILSAELRAIGTRVERLGEEAAAARPRETSERARLFVRDRERLLGTAHETTTLAAPSSTTTATAARRLLERLLPGSGPAADRLARYEAGFLVPRGRLQAVFVAALAACRQQTLAHVALPSGESVAVEYVAGKPWSGYSFYLGGGHSRLQVSRDTPHTVGQLLELACHEGYPGHHVYNTLRDGHLTARGYPELAILPIFGPQGFRAEAVASVAGPLAFSHAERVALLRDTIFPVAGIDPAEAETYVTVNDTVDALHGAVGDALERYLTGIASANETTTALARDALMPDPTALLAFADRYGASALAYTTGRDLVAQAIVSEDATERWENYIKMIVTPAKLTLR